VQRRLGKRRSRRLGIEGNGRDEPSHEPHVRENQQHLDDEDQRDDTEDHADAEAHEAGHCFTPVEGIIQGLSSLLQFSLVTKALAAGASAAAKIVSFNIHSSSRRPRLCGSLNLASANGG
jgi:hypothetical protein